MNFEEIQKLLEEGKTAEANAALDQLMKDNPEAKAIFEEPKTAKVEDKALENKKPEEVANLKKVEEVKDVATPNYEEVFAKVLLGRDLEPQDKAVYEKVNNAAYTHQVSNQPILVPETTLSGILGLIEEQHPFYGDIRKLNVRGGITVKKHKSIKSGDANTYAEGVEADYEENEFVDVKLDGHEIVKDVEVSFKLEAMSIPEFLTYIQTELATRIGYKLGNLAFTGSGTGDNPMGVVTELTTNAADQIIDTAEADVIAYTDITKLRSKVKSQFKSGLKFYASSDTIWNRLANIVDKNGRPIFIANPTTEGVGYLLGTPVAEDDGAGVDRVVLGNPGQGMIENTNEPLSVSSERNLKGRKTLYQGYMITDFTVTYPEAFAILNVKKAAEGGTGE